MALVLILSAKVVIVINLVCIDVDADVHVLLVVPSVPRHLKPESRRFTIVLLWIVGLPLLLLVAALLLWLLSLLLGSELLR